MRAEVLSSENTGGIVHTQLRQQSEAFMAQTDSKDTSQRQLYEVQQRCNMPARHLDGCAPDIQGAPELIHEERQGRRS